MVSFIILAIAVTLASARPQTDSTTIDVVVTTPAGQSPCKDILTTCNLLDKDVYCKGEYFNWAFENCKNYCGLCNYTSTTATAPTATNANTTGHQEQTTVNGTCEYKGTLYYQDDVWTDGCDYNCTCLDASIGYYRCRDLCPTYTNLPPGCTIEKQSGDCCGHPTGCQDYVVTKSPVTIVCRRGMRALHLQPNSREVGCPEFCSYKGKLYYQDETWLDGCTQFCTCMDRGVYTCGNVCLNWENLPGICHLEPPSPGLCCEQPRCPDGVIINIPTSYKDQYPGYNYVNV